MKFFIKIFLSLALLAGIVCVIACKKETKEVCPSGGDKIKQVGVGTEYEIEINSEEYCKLAAEYLGYKYYCYGDEGCFAYSN